MQILKGINLPQVTFPAPNSINGETGIVVIVINVCPYDFMEYSVALEYIQSI
ncbi:MAG: hypothetical protein HRU18_02680 [Pseudoalteromonas sp.]|uniref:hypothetical protein n=1 Tax=Pseudoalteromonas sp. TaxID=53249 RepID=UPI001D7C45AA|nr:hypothetical protein [Pseudoalteromonas sp.]NRA77089.1 hypothetical protein [Pseudoalteromonas sp.]